MPESLADSLSTMTTTWWTKTDGLDLPPAACSTPTLEGAPSISTDGDSGTSSGLPSPTLSSNGSTSPRSDGSGVTEFSWPLDSGLCSDASSDSSGAGSPPLPVDQQSTSIWSSTPVAPYQPQPAAGTFPLYNPLVPPPALPQNSGMYSNRNAIQNFGGAYIDELERLFLEQQHPLMEHPPHPSASSQVSSTNTTNLPFTNKRQEEAQGSLIDLRGEDFAPRMWEDFERNGVDRDLDEMDRMMRNMNCKDKERKPRRLPTIDELRRHDQRDPIIQKTILLRMVSDAEAKGKTHPVVHEIKNSDLLCRFCWKNGETEVIYKSHNLKDKQGRIQCPILYVYECPTCGAKGQNSHTKKYCPLNNVDIDAPSVAKTGRNSAGKRRIVGQNPLSSMTSPLLPYTYADLQLVAAIQNYQIATSGSTSRFFNTPVSSSSNKLWPSTLDSYLNVSAHQLLALKQDL